MRLGFCGSHRSGKSTLAKLTSKEYNIPFIPSPASAIAASHGFNMASDNRLDTGMQMQWEIFDSVCAALETCSYVTDRTPIDVAAYLLADATAGAGTLTSQEDAVLMVEKAIRETQRLFDVIILVPPVVNFVVEDGKPPMNPAYQEHHHFLCRGILFDEDLSVYWDEIKRDTFSLDLRMNFVRETIAGCGLFAKEQVAA